MAAHISSAEQFFKDIVESADPASFLRALVTNPPSVYENDWLDFKEGEHLQDGDCRQRAAYIEACNELMARKVSDPENAEPWPWETDADAGRGE